MEMYRNMESRKQEKDKKLKTINEEKNDRIQDLINVNNNKPKYCLILPIHSVTVLQVLF